MIMVGKDLGGVSVNFLGMVGDCVLIGVVVGVSDNDVVNMG